jgi:hypothetical protein
MLYSPQYNLPHDQLDHLFESINGLFYTGGGLSLRPTTPYYDSAYYLYKKYAACREAQHGSA